MTKVLIDNIDKILDTAIKIPYAASIIVAMLIASATFKWYIKNRPQINPQKSVSELIGILVTELDKKYVSVSNCHGHIDSLTNKIDNVSDAIKETRATIIKHLDK